jgi:glycosyltransferase involved in cell wall biosynthesis
LGISNFSVFRMANTNLKVAFSVTNCICNDQRVRKIAGIVNNMGMRVTIIGRVSPGCCNTEIFLFGIVRFKMFFRKGFLFYKFYNIRLLIHLLFNKYDILVANDLDTLLPNYIISKLRSIPLVYDSHEYFTGVPEIQKRPVVKWVWSAIEKAIFPDLNYVMTVSNSIALQYEKEYFIRPLVIMNAGVNTDHIKPYSRAEIGLPENDLLLIIHGTGINADRGGKELLEALKTIDGVSLLIVGSGDTIPELKEIATDKNLSVKVRFIQTVPWEELIRYLKMADTGLSLDKDTNLNYKFSLPNKLFDYISAGIPVIAGKLPEITGKLKEFNCGLIIETINPENIKVAIEELKSNREKLKTLKANAMGASEVLNWENERKKLLAFYSEIFRIEGIGPKRP